MQPRYVRKVVPDDQQEVVIGRIKLGDEFLDWQDLICSGCGQHLNDGVIVGGNFRKEKHLILCGQCIADAAYKLGEGRNRYGKPKIS